MVYILNSHHLFLKVIKCINVFKTDKNAKFITWNAEINVINVSSFMASFIGKCLETCLNINHFILFPCLSFVTWWKYYLKKKNPFFQTRGLKLQLDAG